MSFMYTLLLDQFTRNYTQTMKRAADNKRRVVDLMITTIAATSDSLNITWKI